MVAVIKSFKGLRKRIKSSSSSQSDKESTPSKRLITEEKHQEDIAEVNQSDTCESQHCISAFTMDDPIPEKEPQWVSLLCERRVAKLHDKIDRICEVQANHSTMLEELTNAHSMLEEKINKAVTISKEAKCDVLSLSGKMELLSTENKRLKDKLQESETYSKCNNLKFF